MIGNDWHNSDLSVGSTEFVEENFKFFFGRNLDEFVHCLVEVITTANFVTEKQKIILLLGFFCKIATITIKYLRFVRGFESHGCVTEKKTECLKTKIAKYPL
jgi:hypothetical protein